VELDDLKKDFDLLVAELRACGAQGDDIHHLNCPFHDDKSGSLSAYTSKEGFAQFKCHGCDASGSVVDARIRRNKCSLKEAIESLTGENGHHPPAVAAPVKKKEYRKYPDYDTMIASMSLWAERNGNKLVKTWKYVDPCNDKIDYITVRINIGGEAGSKGKPRKQFLQAHAIEGGFQVGGCDLDRLPLYNRKGVANAKRVVVVEGEKCVDALLEMGIPATTSPMGAKSAKRGDWSPLAGKEVILWPDNDEGGREYVNSVAMILEHLNPPCSVKLIKTPSGLTSGQDVFDYIAMCRKSGLDDSKIKGGVEEILGVSESRLVKLYKGNEIEKQGAVILVQTRALADKLYKYGFFATCPEKENSAFMADWTPLKDKKTVFWRDNSEAGEKFQAAALSGLEFVGNKGSLWSVRVERLRLSQGQTVADYIDEMVGDGGSEAGITNTLTTVIERAVRVGFLARGATLSQLMEFDITDDPNLLLGRRWLCMGGACLIAGQTGIGKSTLAMQMAITWATGKSFFGIQPVKPLKSMFIQAENDMGDLAEQAQGVMKGMKLQHDAEKYNDMVLVIDEDELAGDAFIEGLRSLVSVYRPDLVFIDPLHAYLGGDINDAEVCSKFLRRGLNPIAHEYKCAIIILHHTKKPSMEIAKQFSMGDYSYFGAGSAELANWPRAIMVLRALEEKECAEMGVQEGFQLVAAKRGKRAGLSTSESPFDGSEKTNQSVTVKHSSSGLCWEPMIEQKPIDESDVDGTNDDVTLAVKAVYKAMIAGQTYEQADLREVFCQVTGTKFSSQLNNKGKKRTQWQACMKHIPRNPQAPAKFMKTTEEMPEFTISKKKTHKPAEVPPGDHGVQPEAKPDAGLNLDDNLPFSEA